MTTFLSGVEHTVPQRPTSASPRLIRVGSDDYRRLMAEARAEYDAWLIEWIGRHGLHFAALNVRRHISAKGKPPCWCGKKVKGRGLCANHLSQSYRRETGRVTGKHVRNRVPTCGHPDRKHKARGLCSACHQRERANAKRARAAAA